jgi:transcriptional regulator with XRE-family HTH domain
MNHSQEVESLPKYVQRVMKERGLKPKDVEKRSGGKIVDAYVTKIIRGKTKYPSVVKLQALAEGLGVDEEELFRVARGVPLKEKKGGELWPGPVLIKVMERIIASPELTRAVQALLSLKPARLKAVVALIESKKE